MTPRLLRLIKFTKFLRFLRLLRVLKLKDLIQKLEETIINETALAIINLMRVIIVVTFVGHWMACLFFQIGSFEMENDEENWIVLRGLHEKEPDEKYITSLYWAFTTMTTTGYGDITPITNIEKLFVISCMLVSCVVFAYVVGSISSVVERHSMIEEQYKDKILHVTQFLLHQNIPRKIRVEVKKYLI